MYTHKTAVVSWPWILWRHFTPRYWLQLINSNVNKKTWTVTESISNPREHLECFVEPDDVGMSQDGHDARLAVQIGPLVLVLHFARVDYLYCNLYMHSVTLPSDDSIDHASSPLQPLCQHTTHTHTSIAWWYVQCVARTLKTHYVCEFWSSYSLPVKHGP